MTHVSVIIPAYNAGATLDRTLASVRAQTHPDLEIIVVNDGSTDDTAERAARHAGEDPRIRVLQRSNGGVAAARNQGIAEAVHDWVALIDADDIWHPQTVSAFLAAAGAAPEPAVFVYTWSRRIDADDRVIVDLGRPRYSGRVLARIIAANFTRNASATMMRRDAVIEAGGYDSGLQAAGAHGAEDIDLYLRLAAAGPVAVAEGFHVGYRQVEGSMSQNADRMHRSVNLALGKAEAQRPQTDPAVFRLARTNYDLYAAAVCFAAGRWPSLLGYAGKAIARSPAFALAYLTIVGPYSLGKKLRPGARPAFADLDPQATVSWPLADLLMALQDRLFRRILGAGEGRAA